MVLLSLCDLEPGFALPACRVPVPEGRSDAGPSEL